MKLIIGGAFQGKRDFAMHTLGIPEEEMFTCSGAEIDFSKTCIDRLEEYIYACLQKNTDPLEGLKKADLRDKVLICMDMSCGVVPLGADMRQWRQTTGLVCQYLAARADSVHRIFCGLEQRLK